MYVSVNDEDEATDHTYTSCIILGTWHPVLYGKGRTLLSGRVVSRHITTTVCVYNLWKSELHFPFPLHPFLVSSSAGLGQREPRLHFAAAPRRRSDPRQRERHRQPKNCVACDRTQPARTPKMSASRHTTTPAGTEADPQTALCQKCVPRAREVFTSPTQPHRSSAPPCCRTCGGRSRYARLQERTPAQARILFLKTTFYIIPRFILRRNITIV